MPISVLARRAKKASKKGREGGGSQSRPPPDLLLKSPRDITGREKRGRIGVVERSNFFLPLSSTANPPWFFTPLSLSSKRVVGPRRTPLTNKPVSFFPQVSTTATRMSSSSVFDSLYSSPFSASASASSSSLYDTAGSGVGGGGYGRRSSAYARCAWLRQKCESHFLFYMFKLFSLVPRTPLATRPPTLPATALALAPEAGSGDPTEGPRPTTDTTATTTSPRGTPTGPPPPLPSGGPPPTPTAPPPPPPPTPRGTS